MNSILQQHIMGFAREELLKEALIHALTDEDKKLDEVDIIKAIEAQFPMDDLDEMIACGMSFKDVSDYLNEKNEKFKRILMALDVAQTNLAELTMALKEKVGGNYNDQT